jgi:hypothetical protein
MIRGHERLAIPIELQESIRSMSTAECFSSAAKLLLVVGLAGCSGKGLVPVDGVVTLDGKPLADATVTLLRSEGPVNERVFFGETDATGRYTILSADRDSTGAPPGEFKLTISSVKMPANINETTKLPPERVPPRWRNGSQTFTVPEGGTTEANFVMTSR